MSPNDAWLAKWLDAVEDGSATMSQRARSSINKNGGISAAIAAATLRKVHLIELRDDKGKGLIAASSIRSTRCADHLLIGTQKESLSQR